MNNPAKHTQAGFAHMVLILIVVGALAIGAGVFVYGQQNKANQLASTDDASSVSLTEPLPADLLTIEKVKELAQADKPNLTIQQIELESEGNILLYKIRMSDGSFVLYNARSGVKVTKNVGSAAEVEKDDSLPANFTAAISFDKAREIALKEKPSGTIRKIELEAEGGVVVYSVRFTDDARVDVNATTGAIVRTRPAKKPASTTNSTNPDQPVSNSSNSGSGSSSSGSGSSGSGNSGSSGGSSGSSRDGGNDDSGDDDDDNSGSNSGSGSSNSGSGSSGSGSDDD